MGNPGTPSHIKRAFGLGLKVVLNFEKLSEEVLEYYEQHLDKIPAALERGFVIPQQEEKPIKSPLTFSVIATTTLGRVAGKKTKECFTGKWYAYRDSDFDGWLGKQQPDAPACTISVCAVNKDWIFAEAARALPGVEQTSDIAALGRSLIANGYTMTLPQAEEMVEATERGESAGLRTDGYGNFFFVETGDAENPVSVGYVDRGDRVWLAILNRLDNVNRWRAGRRLLVCNLDASKLWA